MFPEPTWLVGCGNMGGAMVAGWRAGGVDLTPVVVIRPSGSPVDNCRTVTSFAEAGPPPRLVILGFKPQKLDEIAPELARWTSSKTTIVSLLAGAEAASLRQRFRKAAIVRAMPNLPVSIRRGVVALYSEDADDAVRRPVADLFSVLGFTLWAESEKAFSAIGSVAGSGPAYVARFIEALAAAAVERGLPEQLASTLALETVLGTGWMAAAGGEPMRDIARRVASPNGTTEAGLAVLDSEGALEKLVSATIDAAARRGAELAEEARGANLADAPTVP